MNKGPEHPKVSFLVARQTLDKVTAFAHIEGMKLSEAMRMLLEAGLESLAYKSHEDAARMPTVLTPTIGRSIGTTLPKEPTRGKFPRPTRSHAHDFETEQE